MKKFLEPSIEVQQFTVEDIITESSEDIGNSGDVGGGGGIDW